MAADINIRPPYGATEFKIKIKDGEKVLIASPPGSGKSAIVSCLTGSVHAEGSAYINGTNIMVLDSCDRGLHIAAVHENAESSILFPTADEEIEFALRGMGMEESRRKEVIDNALRRFGLEGFNKVSCSEMSGGERRRLTLSTLFAINPALMVLDEAFDDLSESGKEILAGEIKNTDRMVLAFSSSFYGKYSGIFDRITDMEGKDRDKTENRIHTIIPNPGIGALTLKNIIIEREARSDRARRFSLSIDEFSFRKGDAITLTGDNGSGKSTFSRFLSGIIREKSGIVSLSAKERRRKVGYIMQNPDTELFLPTVLDELKSTGAGKEKISEVLELFSLKGDGYVSRLPLGIKKILQAAIFFLLERPYVIFDEFDASLPPKTVEKVLRAFIDKGTGILFITHSDENGKLLSGRRMKAEGGRIIEY